MKTVSFYAYNKSWTGGYDVFNLEFVPGNFKNRKETFVTNTKTEKEARIMVASHNGCTE